MIPEPKAQPERRAPLAFPVAAVLLLSAIIAVLLTVDGAGRGGVGSLGSPATAGAAVPGAAAGPGWAEVTIRAQERVTAIPRSFFGLSTEYWTLPVDERHTSLYERVLSLVHVPGDGRFVLRIGGDSSDLADFDSTGRPLPPWAFAVTPSLVARTVDIIEDLRLRVIVDLNTITTTARVTAGWVRAAVREANLPAGSIFGFEIGNEPDLYNHAAWVSKLRHTTFDLARLPRAITPARYARDYYAFAHALAFAAPHVPLFGPALAIADHHRQWISKLLARPHPGLRVITVHSYPYSACARPGRPQYPTVQKLLSERATAGMARTIGAAVALGRKVGLPVRLTEINSVTCGGVSGVSNTFATALWAPDALFELVRAGVAGVNLHARVYSINDPFYFTPHGLRTHPLLYGLILFRRMLGARSRLVPVRLRSPQSLHLKVWAVREGSNTLNVLLINKGGRSGAIKLHLPTSGPASVQRLLAPSASSASQVTLAHQRLDDQVVWKGKARVETIRPTRGGYVLQLRRQSAALLTVHVARTTLTGG